MPRFGAFPLPGGGTEFRVWAPHADAVAVRAASETAREWSLAPEGEGIFAGRADLDAGDDYLFVLGDHALPDPCSRFQPRGVEGPSRVVDTRRYEVAAGPDVVLEDLVLYELHLGTFSEEGTCDGAIPHLAALRELGVTAIEVMPVATFPGNRGWGYDGLYIDAVHPAYGGPDAFARLVDAAHRKGLAVVLDVVYNHLGPGSHTVMAFGPYVTDRCQTPWGDAIDFSRRPVREWALQNAELWVRDFAVDGLRVDAVFAIFDDESPTHILRELRERVPETLLVAEQEPGNLRPLDEWDFDAQWADEFHHELHVALTGERHGYYAQYGSLAGLAEQFERERPERLVFCSQNHDQVGNRATGDRPASDELELRASALLFASATPLLFMGEEYGERNPFRFFTDHVDPFIADATRAGRRREFGFADDVSDPQARETFEHSKLSREELPGMRDLYAELLRLRRALPRDAAARGDDAARILTARRGEVELVADFGTRTVTIAR